jgi:redox-sensing transcriptional repressor
VAEAMIEAGVRGILNFAPVHIKCPEDIVVNNVNLAIELENVFYFVNKKKETHAGE